MAESLSVLLETPLRLALETEEARIPLLIRYVQGRDITDQIRSWMWEDPDAFFRNFVVPEYLAFHGHPANYFDGRTRDDCVQELIRWPYRIFQIQVLGKDENDLIRFRFVNNANPADHIPNVNYCTLGTTPVHILESLIKSLLMDALYTREFDSPFIVICDLYLSRPPDNRALYFHKDSGIRKAETITEGHGIFNAAVAPEILQKKMTAMEVDGKPLPEIASTHHLYNYAPVENAAGHEDVEYISLLYLSQDRDKVLRGTTLVRHSLTAHEDNEALTLAVKDSVKLIINDNCFWHSTPHTSLTQQDTYVDFSEDTPGVRIIERVPPNIATRRSLLRPHIADIENPGSRSFVRGHFVTNPIRQYIYLDPVHEIQSLPFGDSLRSLNTFRISHFDQLNDALNPQGAFSKFAIGGKNKTNKNGGSKKYKKSKTKKHKKEEIKNIFINCDEKDYYRFTKFKSNLYILSDMPFN
uniref:Uncharacterized protein n=1 Tax=viral metagenome TaxID=1070528 RepID=A0A6C0HYY2_9ZZZZ